MSRIDRKFEETHAPPVPDVRTVVGTEPHRAARRPAQSIDDLLDRIRALQRVEPPIAGDMRTSVLCELALIQLRAERLSLDAWRDDGHHLETNLNAAALAEQVDRLSIHWPLEAEPDRLHLGSVDMPNESVPT